MKKWMVFLLTAALAACLSLPASATEAEQMLQAQTAEVSLSSIEQIMEDYSPELKTYLNDLKIMREKKEDAENENPSVEDAADYQYDLAKKEYGQKVQSAVLNAKQAYLACCADSDRLNEAQAAADSVQKSLNDALRALSPGYVSQKEVDSLWLQADQAKSTLARLNDQLAQKKAALRVLLGLPNDVPMIVRPLSAGDVDFSDIPSINYGEDVIEMWKNSAKIKVAKLTYEYTEDYYWTEYELDNADIALQQARASEKAAFQKLYDSLNASYTAYQQGLAGVRQKENELALEQKALSLGYSSQKSVDGKTRELKSLQTTLADSRNTLFVSYLSYINMKNGYSAGA